MKQVNGLWWPDSDRIAEPLIRAEVEFLDEAIQLCRERKIAIQAGGNCGVYPLYLSQWFETVITVEADADNYQCMARNIEDKGVIFALYCALGAETGSADVRRYPENAGASYIVPGDQVSIVSIDSMEVDPDLIQLDIEGMEYDALEGARYTIMRCRPVIMIEDVGHGARYGHTKGSCARFLEDWGYSLAGGNGTDTIWHYQPTRN